MDSDSEIITRSLSALVLLFLCREEKDKTDKHDPKTNKRPNKETSKDHADSTKQPTADDENRRPHNNRQPEATNTAHTTEREGTTKTHQGTKHETDRHRKQTEIAQTKRTSGERDRLPTTNQKETSSNTQ